MADAPTIKANLDVPLAFGTKGLTAVFQVASGYPVVEKFTELTASPALEKVKAKTELLWALLGFVLILHGAQFKGLLLCFHVVSFFFYDKVKASVLALCSDVTTAREKLQADAPAAEKKEEEPAASKHAKKRADAKKGGDKASSGADDAAAAKKALKALDVEKLSSAAMEVFAAVMCCLLVLRGGLAQSVAVGHALVLLVSGHMDGLIKFPGHEDLQEWTDLFVRFAMYVVSVGLSWVSLPLALALYVSLYGATLASDYVLKYAEGSNKLDPGSSEHGSATQLMALAGLTGFGTFWQLWTYLAGSGMAWYFQLLYLPAVVAEAVLSLL